MHRLLRDALLDLLTSIKGITIVPVCAGGSSTGYRVVISGSHATLERHLNKVVHVCAYMDIDAVKDDKFCYFFEPRRPIRCHAYTLAELVAQETSVSLEFTP